MTIGELRCEAVGKRYSGLTALNDVSVTLAVGEVTALVGANGAGKTTFLDVLSGTVQPSTGRIQLGGRDITKLRAWRRARLGLLRGFQDSLLFPDLTVRQTLKASTYRTLRYSAIEAIFRVGRSRRHDAEVQARLQIVAQQYGLVKWLDTEINALSLGMSKIVQLAAVSIAEPLWILLDEPAAGLARAEVDQLALLLQHTSSQMPGCGFLIVEHDAALVSVAADRVILMAEGAVVEDLRRDDLGWSNLLHATPVPRALQSDATVGHRTTSTARPALMVPAPRAHAACHSESVQANGIYVSYGRFEAVHGIDIQIEPGQLAVLVGTNGAGKSSVLNAIVGMKPPCQGTVTVDGRPVDRLSPHRRAQSGLVLVPSGRGLMAELTVAENLRLTSRRSERGPGSIQSLELFPELESRLKQRVGTMSGGEQQMVALARSIQLHPKYLLIDELSLGLNPTIVERLIAALITLRDTGVGLLIVEQNAPLALSYSDHAYVMNNGTLAFSGPSEVAADRPDLFRPVFLDPDSSTGGFESGE